MGGLFNNKISEPIKLNDEKHAPDMRPLGHGWNSFDFLILDSIPGEKTQTSAILFLKDLTKLFGWTSEMHKLYNSLNLRTN